MDKLTQLRTFVRVAERASFSAVARDLAVTQSAVSKAVGALENSLGIRLVNRSTRSVSLTEAGQRYYAQCRQVLADLDAAEASLRDAKSGVGGSLHVAAPVPFGLRFVSPRVVRFQEMHPQLSIQLDLDDRLSNLVEQNIDVAIRLGHPRTAGLVARKLGESPIATVASPGYLAARGAPQRPPDLVAHHCLAYTNELRPFEWSFGGKEAPPVAIAGHYRSNNLLALKEAAVAGLGIARLPLWMVAAEIDAGLLRPVLGEARSAAFGIHAVFPSARQIPAKVRVFVDFMQDELAGIFGGNPSR